MLIFNYPEEVFFFFFNFRMINVIVILFERKNDELPKSIIVKDQAPMATR